MTWLVAGRELRTRGRTRVFAISTVVLVLAVALGVALPAILSRNAKPERVGIVGGSTATLTGIVTEAGRLAGVKVTVVPEPDAATAEARLRSGDLSVVLVNGTEVVVKQVPIGGASSAGGTLPGALAQLAGLAKLFAEVPGAAAAAANGIALPVRGLEAPSGSLANRLTGLFTVVLVWVLISVYGTQIAMGIGEEKSSRVVEVLLSSVRPVQLLIGKVLGIGLLALAQTAAMVAVFIVAGFAAGFVAGARSGRETYDQIIKYAQTAWEHPTVQQARGTAQSQAQKVGGQLADRMPQMAQSAAHSVGGKIPGMRPRNGDTEETSETSQYATTSSTGPDAAS